MKIGIQSIYAERVKSPPTKCRRKPSLEYYEVITGNIIIALNDYFDEMSDKEWEIMTNSITRILKKPREKKGVVKTDIQKINEVTDILKDIIYLNEKEIKKIVENTINNDNKALQQNKDGV